MPGDDELSHLPRNRNLAGGTIPVPVLLSRMIRPGWLLEVSKMAKLVYIPSINPNTWLHLTHQGEATCLRDYSKSPDHAPVTIRNRYTYSQFQSMLSEPGNMVHEDVPFKPHTMARLWHQTIRALNLAYGLPGTPCGATRVDAPEGDRTAPIREDIGPGSPETTTCPKCGYTWPTPGTASTRRIPGSQYACPSYSK